MIWSSNFRFVVLPGQLKDPNKVIDAAMLNKDSDKIHRDIRDVMVSSQLPLGSPEICRFPLLDCCLFELQSLYRPFWGLTEDLGEFGYRV